MLHSDTFEEDSTGIKARQGAGFVSERISRGLCIDRLKADWESFSFLQYHEARDYLRGYHFPEFDSTTISTSNRPPISLTINALLSLYIH